MGKYPKRQNGNFYIDRKIGGKRCVLEAKTIKELDKKLKAWMDKQASAKSKEELGPFFEEVAEAYLVEIESRVRRSTMRGYRPRCIAASDYFKGTRIKEIDAFEISRFYRAMAKQGYSQKTINNQHSVMIGIFQTWIDDARWRGDRNPALNASIPQGKPKVEREPPTPEQIAAVKAHPEGMGFVANFLMYTGMRLGEANGIQVKDIDFKEPLYGAVGSISVNKSYLWHGNQPVLEKTKTLSSMRKVPITSPLRPLLLERCKGLKPDDFVLSQTSKPLTKNEYRCRWERYCLELGFATTEKRTYTRTGTTGKQFEKVIIKPLVTAHQFRHEMATTCYEAKMDEATVQKILGHADIQTTLKIYTHIRERSMTESVKKLEDFYKENL